jgi:DNA-binding FadR family transcriptional regulator
MVRRPLVLEPLAARLAAARISDEGIERVRRTLADERERRDEPGIFAQDVMHVLLDEQSGNSALYLLHRCANQAYRPLRAHCPPDPEGGGGEGQG